MSVCVCAIGTTVATSATDSKGCKGKDDCSDRTTIKEKMEAAKKCANESKRERYGNQSMENGEWLSVAAAGAKCSFGVGEGK